MKTQLTFLFFVGCAGIEVDSGMPRPTDDPTFATDASYDAPSEAWDGEPVRVDPGAPVRAEGFEPGLLAAEHLNHQLGVLGDWVEWLEAHIGGDGNSIQFETARTAHLRFGAGAFNVITGSFAKNPTSFTATTDGAQILIDISNVNDLGSLKKIRVLVNPGTARATAGDRIQVELFRNTYGSFGTPGTPSGTAFDSTTDDGTTNLQWIELDLGTVSVQPAGNLKYSYTLCLTAGADASTFGDAFFAIDVEYESEWMHP